MGVNVPYSTALQGRSDTYLSTGGSYRTSGTVLSWRTLRKWGKHKYLSFIMYPITLHFLFRTLLGLTLLLTVLVCLSVSSALLVVDVRKVVFGAPHHRSLTPQWQAIASGLIFLPTPFFFLSATLAVSFNKHQLNHLAFLKYWNSSLPVINPTCPLYYTHLNPNLNPNSKLNTYISTDPNPKLNPKP